MAREAEIKAALEAFNRVRTDVGGIKTDDQQRYAINEALDAVDRVRADERRLTFAAVPRNAVTS